MRFSTIIERQEQLERIIQQWGFLPFFKNHIKGYSIQEMTPPQLLFGDDMMSGPWQWKGPIIANWQTAYGKFFKGKAGYVSLEWLPDFINWRRSQQPLESHLPEAQRIHQVLVENESMLSKELKIASGFTLSRKTSSTSGSRFDALVAQLQMSTYVCIADFEYQVSSKGETYGWGVARYCTPEAMYPEIFPLTRSTEGRTPDESRQRILNHLATVLPDVPAKSIEKLV